MRKLILLPVFIFSILFSTNVNAQVQLDWTRTYAGVSSQYFQRITADPSGNVWICGTVGAFNSSLDTYIMKYNSAGVYTGPIFFNSIYNDMDQPGDIATDASGNVYVAGKSRNAAANSSDIFILKYNSAGGLLWSRMFTTNNYILSLDDVVAIAVDPAGNVYIGGHVVKDVGFDYDFLTVKYSAAGVFQWYQTYNGPANGVDMVRDIAVDATGNVYITGTSLGESIIKGRLTPTRTDYATIKYNTNGVQQWVQRYLGNASNSYDVPDALSIDASGNVYVTGASGISSSTNNDIATVKYNTAGVLQWVGMFQGSGGAADGGTDVHVDGSGNVFVGGYVKNAAGNNDMFVAKYNASGVLQWWSPYDTGSGYFESVTKAGLDNFGNFYVTGSSSVPGISPTEIVTIKYASNGTRAWVARYGSTVGGSENPEDLQIVNRGTIVFANAYIYITGTMNVSGSNSDALTLKYSQPTVIGSKTEVETLPGNFKVGNSPNPFSSSTNINYELSETGRVTINVYDVMGRKVSTLVDGMRTAGSYVQRFNRNNLSDGVYHYQFTVSAENKTITTTKSMVLQRR